METNTQKLTVVYDNLCKTCNVVRYMGERLDTGNNLEFVGMHTEKGYELVTAHKLDMEKSAYAISGEGILTERAEMICTVLGATSFFGRILGNMFRALPGSLADRLYDIVSKHRSHRQ